MMKDRFKFRLYDKAISETVYDVCVGFIKDNCKTNDWVCTDTSYGQITYRGDKLKDIVLMQCTGLKDKNGKLIYEGDIVKDNYEALHYVRWVYDSWQLFPCTQDNYTIYIVDNEIEVIGNIYENPELLEVK